MKENWKPNVLVLLQYVKQKKKLYRVQWDNKSTYTNPPTHSHTKKCSPEVYKSVNQALLDKVLFVLHTIARSNGTWILLMMISQDYDVCAIGVCVTATFS